MNASGSRLSRRNFIKHCATAAAGGQVAALAAQQRSQRSNPDRPPNILIYMNDQQQGFTVHPGHPCRMPNVERLAREGILFRNMRTVAAHCCPSRASFLTGLYPSGHGVFNNVQTATAIHIGLNKECGTYSEQLKKAGYRLVWSGKWHVSIEEGPADRGFEMAGNQRGHGHPSTQIERARARIERWRKTPKNPEGTAPRGRGELIRPGWYRYRLYGTRPPNPKTDPFNPGDLRIVTDALNSLKELLNSDTPWLLYCGPNGPHDPYIIPEYYAKMYDPKDVQLPPNYRDSFEDKPRIYQRQRQYWAQLSDDEVREAIAHYWGYCTMQDDLFGLLLEELDRSDQRDNTVVMYLSDHGDYVGAHGLFMKGVPCFEEAYRVPAVIRWPKGIRNPGRIVDAPVSHVDFAPTIIELAGAEPLSYCHGRSLVPFFKDEAPPDWPDAAFTQFNGVELYYSQRQVITERWKYVYNGFDFDELYDLQEDPHETRNLARERGMEKVIREMVERMWVHAARTDDFIFNPYGTVALAPFGPKIAEF